MRKSLLVTNLLLITCGAFAQMGWYLPANFPPTPPDTVRFVFDIEKTRSKGYSCVTEVGVLFTFMRTQRYYIWKQSAGNKHGYKTTGITDKTPYLTISTSHGYRFSRNIYAGIGVEGDFYFARTGVYYPVKRSGRDFAAIVPVYAQVRKNFLSKRVSPFIDVKVGWLAYNSFFSAKQTPYSAMYEISLGSRIYLKHKLSLDINAGYRLMHFIFKSYLFNDQGYEYYGSTAPGNNNWFHFKPPPSHLLQHAAVIRLGLTY